MISPLRPAELLDALRSGGVEFVVIGGFALAPHGYVRATKDLDIVPAPTRDNLRHLAAVLDTLQARVDLGDLRADELGHDLDSHSLAAGENWVLETTLGRLDVMQDLPGMRDYDSLRASAVEVNGILFAGYEDLVSMKASSGREEDLRDIAALEAARRPPDAS